METSRPALDIEELKKRHKELERQKTTAEANLKNANEQLEMLKQEARDKYGTDNLAELKKLLAEMKEENERKRREYQEHLEQIEVKLTSIDRQYSAARKPD